MDRLNAILKAVALTVYIAVGVAAFLLVLKAGDSIAGISGVVGQANTALATVNRSCGSVGKVQPCGTLAEVDKTLTHISDLTVQTQIAVKHADQVSLTEQAMLPVWNREISDTLGGVNRTVDTANGSLATLTVGASGVLQTANTTLGAAQPLMGRATLFVSHADDLVVQAKPIVANTAEITRQGAIIAKDAKVEEQKYVYPPKTPWYKKIIPTVLKAGELAYDFIR